MYAMAKYLIIIISFILFILSCDSRNKESKQIETQKRTIDSMQKLLDDSKKDSMANYFYYSDTSKSLPFNEKDPRLFEAVKFFQPFKVIKGNDKKGMLSHFIIFIDPDDEVLKKIPFDSLYDKKSFDELYSLKKDPNYNTDGTTAIKYFYISKDFPKVGVADLSIKSVYDGIEVFPTVYNSTVDAINNIMVELKIYSFDSSKLFFEKTFNLLEGKTLLPNNCIRFITKIKTEKHLGVGITLTFNYRILKIH